MLRLKVLSTNVIPLAGCIAAAGWLITASACEGAIGARDANDGDGLLCAATELPPTPARLLTRSEYKRTVFDLLGETADPTRYFPPEPEVEGFNNNANSHIANPLLVERFAEAARELAAAARDRGLRQLVPCEGSGRPCAEQFIEELGLRAFRRRLEGEERMAFLQLYDRASQTLGHEEALTAIVEAILQSPQFLYRVEAPPGDESAESVPLGGFELASRLSYFLWGTMPDDALFAAATDGTLTTRDGVEQEARRMLDDARAEERVREFHEMWMSLDRLDGAVRDGAPENAGAAWRESLLAYLDGVFWSDDGTTRELFTSSELHLDETLAPLYGFSTDAQTPEPFDAGDGRRGLLSQPGLLALLSHSAQSSPILRGVFFREQVLCAPVPAPPPNVNNNPPDPDPNLTTRERFRVHTENAACASCHSLIDPVGFGFEGFDHLGRVRTEEHGLAIDTSGELVSSPDPALDGPFDHINELSERLADSDVVVDCMTRKWFTFAFGRPDQGGDQCGLDAAVQHVQEAGGSLREMLVAITSSPSFRFRPASQEVGP